MRERERRGIEEWLARSANRVAADRLLLELYDRLHREAGLSVCRPAPEQGSGRIDFPQNRCANSAAADARRPCPEQWRCPTGISQERDPANRPPPKSPLSTT